MELADKEFENIRNKINEYSKTVALQIIDTPGEVLIDSITLRSYINSSKLVKKINTEIASLVNTSIKTDENISRLARGWHQLKNSL